MKWQQKNNALVKCFGRARWFYHHGEFTVQLDNGWVSNSAGVNRETGHGKTAPQALSDLFDKMAHPAPGNVPGDMFGCLHPKKWNSHGRKFVPV